MTVPAFGDRDIKRVAAFGDMYGPALPTRMRYKGHARADAVVSGFRCPGQGFGRSATPGRCGRVVQTLAPERVAVVTGGNRGLGLEVVRRLAGLGMRVVLACRDANHGRAAIERLGALADRVAVRQLDVGDEDSIAGLETWLDRRLGRCDVLVNNASVLLDADVAAAHVDLDQIRRTFDTNLFGMWRLIQAVTPLMRARGYGRIVNISCGLAFLPGDAPAYRVSKSAVNALTRVFADDLAADGILVNACCPVVSADRPNGRGPVDRAMSADTPVWLATLPADGPTGDFWRSPSLIDS